LNFKLGGKTYRTEAQASLLLRRFVWTCVAKSAGIFALSITLLAVNAFAADTLTGTVTNGTTGKPAAGDEVVLLKLGQGMEEGGRTKADASGRFTFKLDDAGSPHLIRAIHQEVTYHKMAPPGVNSVDVEVYDVSKRLDALSVTADVMRIQAQSSELQGIRLFAVQNDSKPPRTQMNDQNFEFYLPDGATVDTGLAKTANGQPITSAPVPEKEKNKYSFIFPLRPGETQFQVVFHMPYSGEATIDPKPLYPTQHFVVMVPKSIHFAPVNGGNSGYQSMNDPNNSEAQVQVASNTTVSQPLAFKITGTGSLPGENGGGTTASGGQQGGATARPDNRPGGGIGPPIDAPDPLEKYRWYILGGFAAALAAGGIYIATRSKGAPVPDYDAADVVDVKPPVNVAGVARTVKPAGAAMLLEALKEELFQLELDHKQGRIPDEEYTKAKSALDQTLERALKRESAKAT
jgi:hypothetical protein